METEEAAPVCLLELPDACLLVVLRCLAADSNDPASLASTALTHSRLHQAAVAARSSITRKFFKGQLESLLLYLDRHGQHVDSLALVGAEFRQPPSYRVACAALHQLPTSLVQLTSLHLSVLDLQLQPGGGFQGMVTPGLPLKQLRLHDWGLLDGEGGLAAALSLLPTLEHLSVRTGVYLRGHFTPRFPSEVLLQLQRLTYLDLECPLVEDDEGLEIEERSALQPLQALNRLADLRLSLSYQYNITADVLSGSPHLTRLDAAYVREFEPAALAGKTALQHLYVHVMSKSGGTAGSAQLLSHVQDMQQLTYLDLSGSLVADEYIPPPAAFSALTASSRLQVLRLQGCVLPGPAAGVWQRVFPAGRQLPHLTSLCMWHLSLSGPYEPTPAPEGSRLISCCPGLRCLRMEGMQHSAAHLVELQRLLELRTLQITYHTTTAEAQAVVQLTQLKELLLRACGYWGQSEDGGLLLHLTGLKQLTRLDYSGLVNVGNILLETKAPGDEPVWIQLLQHLSKHSDSESVVQQAAAALGESNT